MTPEDIELVRKSYACLGADAPAMAADFYRRLFAADPSAQALFSTGPDIMSSKFAQELDAIVEAIISYDTFAARVRDLASRHARYGVKATHYRSVGDALIAALAAQLAGTWDPATETAWRRAYNLVAEIMMATPSQL